MAEPAHNFVVDSDIITSNSHAYCVALDSLYGAWAKAHHPLEYYTTLLENYSAKGDKERIAKAKEEAQRAFGISFSLCKFRQDNRSFYIDRTDNSISDSLSSVRDISKGVAEELYRIREMKFESFADMLYYMLYKPMFSRKNIYPLICMGYFSEFGTAKKLLAVYDEFYDGEMKVSKAHIEKTQLNRLLQIKEFEKTVEDGDLDTVTRLRFELEYFRSPIVTDEKAKNMYAVLEVDDKYSPKIKMYSVVTGKTGMMKVKKDLFKKTPIKKKDILVIQDGGWQRKPAYRIVNKKPIPIEGVYDIWMEKFEII